MPKAFDYRSFLTEYRIPFVTEGKNVASGNINIKCPFCGDDPSEHLGIEEETGKWSCWRNVDHRGRSPEKLIVHLTGCSWAAAKKLLADGLPPDVGSFEEFSAKNLFDGEVKDREKYTPVETVEFLPEFRVLKSTGVYSKFWKYLENRGFTDGIVSRMSSRYTLRCALTGRFKFRLIMPLYSDAGMVGWVARSITYSNYRYLTYPSAVIKKTLFNIAHIRHGGEVLFLVEGVFDAMKINVYGIEYGAKATCLLGRVITEAQVAILASISRKFRKLVILLDADALGSTLSVLGDLGFSSPVIGKLPKGVSDPGEMSREQVIKLIKGN